MGTVILRDWFEDPVDDALGAMSFFDFVTPMGAVVEDVIHLGAVLFAVPQDAGYTVNALVAMLKQAGFHPWQFNYVFKGNCVVSVSRQEGAQVAQFFDRKKIPFNLEGGGDDENADANAGGDGFAGNR